MSQSDNSAPKSPTSHLHAMNLVVALLAGVISITGGIYSLKNNIFSGPTYGSLQGIVRDEKIAKPLKLVSVEVADLTGAVVNTAATDDDGHYLIESLKTGNYVVKFMAPLHKIENKTIKIEKDLKSSINVDLVPETVQANVPSAESAAVVPQNIRAPYVPAATNYNGTQTTPPVPTPTSVYSQTGSAQDSAFSGSPHTGYRRHPRHSYPTDTVDNSSGASQSASQGDVLTQAGAQLLQAWLAKKSESNSSTTSSSSGS